MAKKNYLDDIDNKFLVRIYPHKKSSKKIKAHLPDDFGFSVGSEIDEPFSQYLSGGMAQTMVAAGMGTSAKGGLFSKRFWMGPEQTDINLNLNFYSYYSAVHEVLLPIKKLMQWSVGREKNISDIKWIEKILPNEEEKLPEDGGNVDQMFKFFAENTPIDLQFGNVFSIKEALISTASPSFSNVLDNQGYPISGSIDLTVIVRQPFHKERIGESFKF